MRLVTRLRDQEALSDTYHNDGNTSYIGIVFMHISAWKVTPPDAEPGMIKFGMQAETPVLIVTSSAEHLCDFTCLIP